MSRNALQLIARLAVFLGGSLLSVGLLAAAEPKDPPKDQAPNKLQDDEVLKELHRLGATVRNEKSLVDQRDAVLIVLPSEWHGSSDDLKLLKRVPSLWRLTVLGAPITDDDLKQLDGLSRLSLVELFGTKVTAKGVEQFAKMYPGITIDRRGNAMLGIAGKTDPAGLRILRVQPKSAADDSGLMPDDIIVKIDDHEVSDFQQLTALIGARDPGNKITVELKRGSEVLKKEVKLGAWK